MDFFPEIGNSFSFVNKTRINIKGICLEINEMYLFNCIAVCSE